MFYNPYTALKERLNTIAGIKNVAWYTDSASIHTTPAIYIEFMPADAQTQTRGHQRTTLRFNVHLITSAIAETDGDIRDPQLQLHSQLDQAVFDTLQDFYKEGILENTNAERLRIVPHNAMLHTVHEFSAVGHRQKTTNYQAATQPKPDIDVSVRS